MLRKLIFACLIMALLSATPIFGGSHSNEKKPQFMWIRTYELKPGVSSVEAEKVARGVMDFVNNKLLQGNGILTMLVPVAGPSNKFSFFYISDSIDDRIIGRSRLVKLEGFQPHFKAMMNIVESADDQWFTLPSQDVIWSPSSE